MKFSPNKEVNNRNYNSLNDHDFVNPNNHDKTCPSGTVLNIDGLCAEPLIERRVFIFSSPEDEGDYEPKLKPVVTSGVANPRVDYNVILINNQDDENKEEFIDPSDIGAVQTHTALESIPAQTVIASPKNQYAFPNGQFIPIDQIWHLGNEGTFFQNPNFAYSPLNNRNAQGNILYDCF